MTKSYVLAQKLSQSEWKRFVREVKKGILSQHRDTQRYVISLDPYYPNFDVEDTALHHAVYPLRSFSGERMRVLRTYFYQLLEDFLLKNLLNENQLLREKLLARALLDRNCVSQARLLLDARMDKIEKAELSVTDIQHFFEMEEMGLEVYVRLNKRTDGYDWMRLFRRLSDFLLTHRLRFLCAMKNESNFVRLDVEDFLVQKRNALRDVEQLGDNVHPLTQIYAHLLQLFTEEDYFVHFTAVQKWIRNHARQLAEVEQLNILGLWTNFLIQSERRGLENCLPMVLAAYQTLMEQNMLYEAGSYSINFARNALAVAARLGELEWGWQFLDHAKGQFNETEAHKLYFYGAACLEHAAGNNSKAKKILAKGDFSDPFYKVAQALLLLRICFDTHEDDLFLSIHASIYRQMFRKEKVTSTYRQSIQNFLKLIKALFDLRALAANAQQIAEWKVQYVGYPVIALREWLLARMAQLES